ncbi:hypothetical protein [Methylorubrum extorquens]|uniref:GIY-YIG domain-containing protein n=1 Tax=Methylorubrum extorquens (strain ATCC 14718 / DSM 1338 / JCM 2805 / NCIMB 9133 / AM1) TaxID=272630 RepID=C5ATN6_METEA|nr:hypothetical protein [Methylorubrum extorquens]ACS40560.1 conserved hypothetical protein [Methylorubrum extorquens AM1]MCP1541284.1 hypothetical protein [Methylorubrum extorquens]MCP1586179.1 hypothetical protein [Methylorubrum extorquens]
MGNPERARSDPPTAADTRTVASTPRINRIWWEHLAPKAAHRRLPEIDTLLRRWCASGYGAEWLGVAMREGGVFRVRPGQLIPVLHLVSLGDGPFFVAPQDKLRDDHRTVGPARTQFLRPLEDDELALRPEIRIDMVDDPVLLDHARRLEQPLRVLGVTRPAQVFSAPARLLLAPQAWPKDAYVLYQHIFGEGGSYPADGYFYVGVTTRSWQRRWAEHRRAAETGSPLLFHRRFREELAADRVTYVHHKVMAITDDLERLYATEEHVVEGHWHDTRRLNMIPGGKSGLRYLRENGLLAPRTVPRPDERDRLVEAWLREHPRKGLPAPWVTERWKDDAWAVAQICGRDDRLSVEQVRAIRELAGRYPPETIAERIGARNKDQVQRVMDGATYRRVT